MSEAGTTRDQIIATAQRLFAELGYEKVSVQRIIDAVGIAKGTFYHHYKTKEELVTEIMQKFAQSLIDELRPIISDDSLSSVEKLSTYFEQGVSRKLSGDYSEVMQTMMPLMMNPLNAQLVKDITALTQEMTIPLFVPIVEQGVKEGIFQVSFVEDTVRLLLLAGQAIQPRFIVLMAFRDAQEIESEYRQIMRFYQESMERLLGAEPGTLRIISEEAIQKVVAFIQLHQKNFTK